MHIVFHCFKARRIWVMMGIEDCVQPRDDVCLSSGFVPMQALIMGFVLLLRFGRLATLRC